MLNITLNTEKNGIELRFDTKPNTDIITAIKEAGFRWSGKQRMWYAKQDDDTVALANQFQNRKVVLSISQKQKLTLTYGL